MQAMDLKEHREAHRTSGLTGQPPEDGTRVVRVTESSKDPNEADEAHKAC